MTTRRFIWIFAGIALGCFLLALAGKTVLHWPPGAVKTWLGIGSGYLLGAALMRLMPRWWREHCDEMYAQPAGKRYARVMWPIMIGYALSLFGSTWLIRRGIDSVPLRAVVAVVPALSILFLMRAALRYLRETDELQRRIEIECIGAACLIVCFLYFAAGLLQLAKVIDVRSSSAMMMVFPMTMLVYGIAKMIAVRRYR